MRRTTRRTGTLSALVLAGSCVGSVTAGPGLAAVLASVSGTTPTTSGVFAAAPRTAEHDGTAPLRLEWTAATQGVRRFDVANTGTLELVGATYLVETAQSGRGNPQLTMTACVGARWSADGTCAGTVVELGAWRGTGSFTVAGAPAPAAPGEAVHVQAELTGLPARTQATYTASVSVSVRSGQDRQVRAAQDTSA